MTDENGVVTTEGGEKKIHEVIDMSKTPPDKIIITRADDGKKVEAKLGDNLDDDKKTNTKTYLDDSNTRVKIFTGDKIEAKQPEKPASVENKDDPKQKAEKEIEAKGSQIEDALSKDNMKEIAKKFTYSPNAAGEQKLYQDNLKDLQNFFIGETAYTDKDNKEIKISNRNEKVKDFADGFKENTNGLLAIKNIFTLMNGEKAGSISDDVVKNRPTDKTQSGVTVEDNKIKLPTNEGTITLFVETKKANAANTLKAEWTKKT